MPDQFLYYVTPRLLAAGDLVEPGNWGRMLRGIGARHNAFFRETLLEVVRLAVRPDAVSRLEAAFAFDDQTAADQFVRDDRGGQNIYVVAASGNGTRHDMAWLDVLANVHDPQMAERAARAYWLGDAAPEPFASRFEFLSPDALEVRERVTRFFDDDWPPM
jgi:hypothetical protein